MPTRSLRFTPILALLAAPVLLVATGLTAFAGGGRGHHHREVIVTDGPDDDRSRPYLGIAMGEETEDSEGGARVYNVMPDSPAERAGLEDGDVIVGFEGRPIRGPRALSDRIDEHEPGSSVELELMRDGDRRTVQLELGERPRRFELDFDLEGLEGLRFRMPDGARGRGPFVHRSDRPRLGVSLVEVTPELREHLGGSEDAGVLVGQVMEGMPAEAAGVRVGDLIESVDGEIIREAHDLVEALAERQGQRLSLGIVRDGRPMQVDVSLPAADEERVRPTGPRA